MTFTAPTSLQFFSPAVSTRADSVHAQGLGLYDDLHGQIMSDIDDINQCIYIVIQTPRGSDPHRPLFGCGQFNYIDAPINVARPHIVREVTDALGMWEPRIVVDRVTLTLADMAGFNCAIGWRFADSVSTDVFVTNLMLGSLNVGRAA